MCHGCLRTPVTDVPGPNNGEGQLALGEQGGEIMNLSETGRRARELRRSMAEPEVILWSRLKTLRASGFHKVNALTGPADQCRLRWLVERVDVVEQRGLGLGVTGEPPASLAFEGREERLHDRIVAALLGRHARTSTGLEGGKLTNVATSGTKQVQLSH